MIGPRETKRGGPPAWLLGGTQLIGARSSVVVEALSYKPEGREFETPIR
jgi:hypothetical protein